MKYTTEFYDNTSNRYIVWGIATNDNSRMRWNCHFVNGELAVKMYYYDERKTSRHGWVVKHKWDFWDKRGSDLNEPIAPPPDMCNLIMETFINEIKKNLKVTW